MGHRRSWTTIVGVAVDDYSLGERLGLILRAAITRFTVTTSDLRRLMAQAQEEQRNRRRPDDLKDLADNLTFRHSASIIKRIEHAADAAYADFTEYLDRLSSESEVAVEPTSVRYPVALEQLVALVTANMPPERVAGASRRLVAVSNEDSDAMRYAVRFLQWKHAPPPTTRLGAALLPALVAAFEEVLGAIFRVRLTLHPGEVAQRTFAVATLDRYMTSGDLKRKVIDEKVRDLLDKGPVGWGDRIRQDTHLDVTEMGIDWEHFVEVFERRHVLVHAFGRADDRYLRCTSSVAVRLGDVLICDERYFIRALELLDEAAQLLAIAYFANLTRNEPAPAELASTLLLSYLKQKRWEEALRLAEMVVSGRNIDFISPEVRVNWWMARRETSDGVDGIRAEVIAWKPPNNEARYRLAKAALVFDDNGVRRILQQEDSGPHPLGPVVADWPLVVAMCERHRSLQQLLRGRATNRAQRQRR